MQCGVRLADRKRLEVPLLELSFQNKNLSKITAAAFYLLYREKMYFQEI